jgi:hypothetical protein
MREVLRSSTVTQAHAARLALEAAGIDAVVQGESLSGVFGTPFAVSVIHDDDVAQAREVLESMDALE